MKARRLATWGETAATVTAHGGRLLTRKFAVARRVTQTIERCRNWLLAATGPRAQARGGTGDRGGLGGLGLRSGWSTVSEPPNAKEGRGGGDIRRQRRPSSFERGLN